ncbi:MAG: hypothetical protein LUD68_10760 [Rikenellaceae bacterium]|nr:hypothetical protein [Rikenellaceae bacterium]
MRPRLETENGYKAGSTISSASLSAFLRWNLRGHTLKAQGLYGSNLSHLSLIGGYGKRLTDTREDYDYTNLKTWSLWVDFETRPLHSFQVGVFGGYMENLGAMKAVDPAVIYACNADLHSTGRISPRITWSRDRLLLGVEYSLYQARWGKEFDSHYRPVETYPITTNHRGMILVRYAF